MTTPQRSRRGTAGFTLIEILVVLLVMALLLTFMLPSFLKAIQRQKLVGAAQQTAILLRLARLQAIKTATNTVVQIDTTKGTVTAFGDPNNNQTFDADEMMLGRVDLPKGVTFMAVYGFTSPPTPAVAIFRSDGSMPVSAVTGGGGAFRLQNTSGDQLQAHVLTATSGRIVIEKNDGSGNWLQNGQGGNVWKWN
jgi:prepilin-type N-terminal cleavage/methylation domain-containing protein